MLCKLGALPGQSISPEGTWKMIDDENGKARAYVKIYSEGNEYEGKITKLIGEDPDKRCSRCPGEKKGQPIVGLVVLEDLKPVKENHWDDGVIISPGSGNTYKCSMWFENGEADELKVRGKHWTGFHRTQTWYRVE